MSDRVSASATARSALVGSPTAPITTMRRTPAARARASTSARSASNSGPSTWACESNSSVIVMPRASICRSAVAIGSSELGALAATARASRAAPSPTRRRPRRAARPRAPRTWTLRMRERGEQHAARGVAWADSGASASSLPAASTAASSGVVLAVSARRERLGVVSACRASASAVPRPTRASSSASAGDERRAAARVAELGERVRDVEARAGVGVRRACSASGTSARASPIAPSESAAAATTCGSLVGERRDERHRTRAPDRSRRATSRPGSAGRPGRSRSALASGSKPSAWPSVPSAIAAFWRTGRRAVVEPLDERRQRRAASARRARRATLHASARTSGWSSSSARDQRVDRAPLLGRVGDLAERVRGVGARLRAAAREVAQRGVERDRGGRREVRHGACCSSAAGPRSALVELEALDLGHAVRRHVREDRVEQRGLVGEVVRRRRADAGDEQARSGAPPSTKHVFVVGEATTLTTSAHASWNRVLAGERTSSPSSSTTTSSRHAGDSRYAMPSAIAERAGRERHGDAPSDRPRPRRPARRRRSRPTPCRDSAGGSEVRWTRALTSRAPRSRCASRAGSPRTARRSPSAACGSASAPGSSQSSVRCHSTQPIASIEPMPRTSNLSATRDSSGSGAPEMNAPFVDRSRTTAGNFLPTERQVRLDAPEHRARGSGAAHRRLADRLDDGRSVDDEARSAAEVRHHDGLSYPRSGWNVVIDRGKSEDRVVAGGEDHALGDGRRGSSRGARFATTMTCLPTSVGGRVRLGDAGDDRPRLGLRRGRPGGGAACPSSAPPRPRQILPTRSSSLVKSSMLIVARRFSTGRRRLRRDRAPARPARAARLPKIASCAASSSRGNSGVGAFAICAAADHAHEVVRRRPACAGVVDADPRAQRRARRRQHRRRRARRSRRAPRRARAARARARRACAGPCASVHGCVPST